ncbi:hypothetical protein Unana1_04067 [Umbelopsis nana]
MAVVAGILIMQQVEPNPSANEDSATADLQPETAQEPQTLSEEAPADKDEETTSQYSTELKESPVLGDKVRLNLLLVSGRKLILEVEKNDTITQVKGLVLKQWPTEWNINTPTSVEEMNIIYLGKFLANESTLEGNGIFKDFMTTCGNDG